MKMRWFVLEWGMKRVMQEWKCIKGIKFQWIFYVAGEKEKENNKILYINSVTLQVIKRRGKYENFHRMAWDFDKRKIEKKILDACVRDLEEKLKKHKTRLN